MGHSGMPLWEKPHMTETVSRAKYLIAEEAWCCKEVLLIVRRRAWDTFCWCNTEHGTPPKSLGKYHLEIVRACQESLDHWPDLQLERGMI